MFIAKSNHEIDHHLEQLARSQIQSLSRKRKQLLSVVDSQTLSLLRSIPIVSNPPIVSIDPASSESSSSSNATDSNSDSDSDSENELEHQQNQINDLQSLLIESKQQTFTVQLKLEQTLDNNEAIKTSTLKKQNEALQHQQDLAQELNNLIALVEKLEIELVTTKSECAQQIEKQRIQLRQQHQHEIAKLTAATAVLEARNNMLELENRTIKTEQRDRDNDAAQQEQQLQHRILTLEASVHTYHQEQHPFLRLGVSNKSFETRLMESQNLLTALVKDSQRSVTSKEWKTAMVTTQFAQ